ncbi:MAG: hypothetical protein NTW86_15415 [Candidatus Sumerlaeota bacterium]|nr:hypothetical protein [Candidatus Sumerlaeota bacterium]
MQVFNYQAFGLSIQSALPLPELVSDGHKPPAVLIRLTDLAPFSPGTGETAPYVEAVEGGTLLSWPRIGTFLIRNGNEILVCPAGDVEERVLRVFILGAAMGVLLRQRGQMVLHGSCVDVRGKAVAFIGWKGSGKSTMAAAMCNRGHALLSDDVVPVQFDETGKPHVQPAYPQIKLWPDAMHALGSDPDSCPRVYAGLEKRAQSAESGFTYTPVPLQHVCVLEQGDALELTSLSRKEALTEFMRHSYGMQLGLPLLRAISLPDFFRQAADLAGRVRASRLNRPCDLHRLSAAACLVEEHLEEHFANVSQ